MTETIQEQRRVIKFWIERCQLLEKENEELIYKLTSFTGATYKVSR
jgi:hypothetical protein